MADLWNVLLVEDDEDDYLITREFLEEIPGRRVELKWVDCYDDAMALVREGGLDICLVDYRIGGHTGLEFLANAKSEGAGVPMVLLTGVGHRDIDVAAANAGAADFLDKSELSATMLDRTIRYAIANAKSMRALAEKTGFLETTLENTGAGIAAFDANGDLTMSNQLFGTFFDRLGIDGLSVGGGISLDKITSVLDVDIDDPASVILPDGGAFELRVNFVPSGGAVVFVIDITEQKNLETAMLQARNEAEAASRAKSAFLSNISHELRTPLHSIIGYSDLILSGTCALDPKDCADQIHESGTHLLGVIESMLSFSKLESGEYSCKAEHIFEIRELFETAAAPVREPAFRRGIDIDIWVEPSIVSIVGDQRALCQMLGNLLSNAVEFSADGSQVDVSLKLLEDGRATLSVRDYGIGMDPDKVERVFVPFVQLDDALDRSHEGTGLGLPIVKALVAHHKADLTVETVPGEGTSVIITLPASSVETCPASEAQVA